jgi:hypothetical protein
MLKNSKINNKENLNQIMTRKIIAVGLFVLLITTVFLFLSSNFAIAGPDIGINYTKPLNLAQGDPRIAAVELVRLLLTFIGIIAVIFIIYAGFLWMTSGGNQEKLALAKKTLINAIIGLVIILAAIVIVSFVINKLSGALTPGGPGTGPGPKGPKGGIGALGNCAIQSVYPEPYQKDVPRNIAIIVTFIEDIDPNTIKDVGNNNIITDGRIRIYKSDDDWNNFITGVKVTNTDNKTFVFQPDNYLGSPSEYIWYSVYLSNDIQKLNEAEGVFEDCGFDKNFEWKFEVSNKIDLTPPQVKESGVFPPPDNDPDTSAATPAEPATGIITVDSEPQYAEAANVSSPITTSGPINVTANGTYNCGEDGSISAAIYDDAGILKVNASGITGVVSGDNVSIDNEASIGCGLTLVPVSGSFSAGNAWTITVTAEKQADTLIVGNITYTFVSGAPSNNEIQVNGINGTAINIASALGSHPNVTAVVNNNSVNIKAKVAGIAGNNIVLTSNSAHLTTIPMLGGQDGGETVTVNDKKDQPRNAVIQINFNEAVNPLTVSGNADDVKDYIKVVDNNGPPNNYLPGKFVMSNQYRTVEFISDNLCGVNGCGEQIYCLPPDSHLRVELVAAALEGCVNCAAKSPFNDCTGGHCYNSATSEFHPLSASPLNGIADLAMNSLDGDRSEDAEGPTDYYIENTASGAGDSYQWSFYISDEIDLNPPVINTINPGHNSSNVSLSDPITIDFDKLMMSSSLRTGSTKIFNGQEYTIHKLINLGNFTNQPVGYWIAKENLDSPPLDGEPDYTRAEIKHSTLADTTSYRAQVGSGVKDIYQNCYKPSSGPNCTGIPSCCGQASTAGSSCP